MEETNPRRTIVEEQHGAWLDQALPNHERLAPIVQSLLESMLQKEKIEY
jgi:hypothetical protein